MIVLQGMCLAMRQHWAWPRCYDFVSEGEDGDEVQRVTCADRCAPIGSIISSALGGWNDVMMLLLLLLL